MLYVAAASFVVTALSIIFLSILNRSEKLMVRIQTVIYPMMALAFVGQCTHLDPKIVGLLSLSYVIWCARVIWFTQAERSQEEAV